ncbi:MAG TPA: NAD(P)/FAD-dependent oxidoreductase, partial [Alloprevotella sp.]|nr:NAD(P)/FAD-dependent oxidoreductase [Alloprevotella sp.]
MTQPSHPYPEVAVIGGGAAGFFLAIHLKQARPETRVVILERSRRLLAKVRISGGGRCNLTNSFASVCDLSHVYPRGHRLMSRLLRQFGPKQTCVWF